jgi:hypothetical protein
LYWLESCSIKAFNFLCRIVIVIVIVIVVVVVFIPDVATYVHVAMLGVRDPDLLPRTPRVIDDNIQNRKIRTSV